MNIFSKSKNLKRRTKLNWQSMSCDEVLKKLGVKKDLGLTFVEVKKRRDKFGKNILDKGLIKLSTQTKGYHVAPKKIDVYLN